eukprot:8020489-Pyramimonas_sp.AAC.1
MGTNVACGALVPYARDKQINQRDDIGEVKESGGSPSRGCSTTPVRSSPTKAATATSVFCANR